MPIKKINNHSWVLIVFWTCCAAYFCAYLGRYNYPATMTGIIDTESLTRSQAGLVSTGFFFAYGVGQFLVGFIGDRFSPKHLITIGLIGSGTANLLITTAPSYPVMLVVWALNGAFQAMLWSPIIRVFTEYFPEQYVRRACLNISPVMVGARLGIYALSAVFMEHAHWRLAFLVASLLQLGVAIALFLLMTAAETRHMVEAPQQGASHTAFAQVPQPRFLPVLPLLVPICILLLLQGVLKDGIANWLPVYIHDEFGISASSSTMLFLVLPVVELAAMYFITFLGSRFKLGEVKTSGILFSLSAAALLAASLWGRRSLGVTLAAFALVNSCMYGVNIMLVVLLPTYFVRFRRVALVCGITDSSVYLGSSIATYAVGALVDSFGWHSLPSCMAGLAVSAVLLTAAVHPKWSAFVRQGAQIYSVDK